MSKLSEFIQSNKASLYAFAAQNTPKNEDGQPIIPKGDEWRDENEWDLYYNEVKSNCNQHS